MSKQTVYQRIMQAHKLGRGLHLTAIEVADLANDDCIETRAEKDDLNDEGCADKEHF